jgi:hypothetical protein
MKREMLRVLIGTIDAPRRTYSYKILRSALPVVSYAATIAVLAGPTGGSVVEWTSTFKAAPGTDDAIGRTAMEEIYDAGLANLKAKEATK